MRFSDGPAPGSSEGQLALTRRLPNPVGDEDQEEEATVKNLSTADIDLAGYRLRDLAGKYWELSGTLAPNEAKTFKRNGQAMAMNNGGDTIDLLAPDGTVLQTVTYDRVAEEEEVLR